MLSVHMCVLYKKSGAEMPLCFLCLWEEVDGHHRPTFWRWKELFKKSLTTGRSISKHNIWVPTVRKKKYSKLMYNVPIIVENGLRGNCKSKKKKWWMPANGYNCTRHVSFGPGSYLTMPAIAKTFLSGMWTKSFDAKISQTGTKSELKGFT